MFATRRPASRGRRPRRSPTATARSPTCSSPPTARPPRSGRRATPTRSSSGPRGGRSAAHGRRSRRSRRRGRTAPHIEGDTAGDVTVSFTHDVTGGQRYIYAVDRPNSGPWGTQTPLGGPLLADNISDLVVAPNSGRATVFWQDGDRQAPLAARMRAAGHAQWITGGTTAQISGNTPGRLDLAGARPRRGRRHGPRHRDVDRAASKVLTAYRIETAGSWTAPATPARSTRATGRLRSGTCRSPPTRSAARSTTWTAGTTAPTASHSAAPARGTPWSAPKPIDGVPADAAGQDLAVDDTGRVAYVWSADDGGVQRLDRWRSPPTATR